MARLWNGGAELNSTASNEEVESNSGTGVIQTSVVRTGTYAWQCNPAGTTPFFRKQIFAADQSIVGFLRVCIYIGSLPDVNINIIRFATAANSPLARIDLTTTGVLRLKNSNDIQVGSDSPVLSTGRFYIVELKLDASSSPGSVEGKIDGVVFASGANSSQGNWARILWGTITPNNTSNIYFDDIALNDSSGSYENSYPGDGKIIRLKPNAGGDANSMLKDGGGAGNSSNYNKCNETNPNDATNYVIANALNAEDMYNVEDPAIGDSDIIKCVTIGCRVTNNVADATTAIKLQVEKAASGTIAQGSAIIPNTTTWVTDGVAANFLPTLVLYNDPDGNPWTKETIKSMQIGQKCTAFGTNQIYITAIWAYVEYLPRNLGKVVMKGQAVKRASFQ